jgi:hypothetical protein
MKTIESNCPNCGAEVSLEANQAAHKCKYCNSELQVVHDKLVKIELFEYNQNKHKLNMKIIMGLGVLTFVIVAVIGIGALGSLVSDSQVTSDINPAEVATVVPVVTVAEDKTTSATQKSEKKKAPPKEFIGELDSEFTQAIELAFAEFVLEDYKEVSYLDSLAELDSGTLVKVSGNVLAVIPVNHFEDYNNSVLRKSKNLYLVTVGTNNDNLILVEIARDTLVNANTISRNSLINIYGVVHEVTPIYSRHLYDIKEAHRIVATVVENQETSSLIAYEDVPFEICNRNQWGEGYFRRVDSFNITAVEGDWDRLKIRYEIAGMVQWRDYLVLELNCYDENGVFLDNYQLFEKVTTDESFKIKGEMNVPLGTVRVEFCRDS